LKSNNTISAKIALVLHANGNEKCIAKAKDLEKALPQTNSFILRDLGLRSSDVISIASIFKTENEKNNDLIKSLSLSYNPEISDLGAIELAKHLPICLNEIGLVGCGISDVGGAELLKQIKKLPNLNMICIEGNNFSKTLKTGFATFGKYNPKILVIV
jgi:hypothetical protein